MSLSRRLEEARQAFRRRNAGASGAPPDPERPQPPPEGHVGAGGAYLGEVVYGGLDGIITTFAVVSGVAGAELGSRVILILGLANLFADGFSMATGAYLSSKSEQELYQREWRREAWEVEQFPDAERRELTQIYRDQGHSEEEAERLVEIKARDPDRLVRAMMVEELGMLEDDRLPLFRGLATLVAFIIAGAVPLLVYLVGLVVPLPAAASFPTSIALSGVALFALGAAKVRVTGLNPWRSGVEMLLVGGLAAGVAYVAGALLKGIGA